MMSCLLVVSLLASCNVHVIEHTVTPVILVSLHACVLARSLLSNLCQGAVASWIISFAACLSLLFYQSRLLNRFIASCNVVVMFLCTLHFFPTTVTSKPDASVAARLRCSAISFVDGRPGPRALSRTMPSCWRLRVLSPSRLASFTFAARDAASASCKRYDFSLCSAL